MRQKTPHDPVPRRSFLSRLTAGAAGVGAALGAGATTLGAQPSTVSAGWQPARHAEDDWFEQTPARHRFFMDTTSPAGLAQAMGFARNFFEANRTGYGLSDADVAQIICVRHKSTPFGFSSAMWAKYGAALSERADGFLDPKTKQPPAVNVYQVAGTDSTSPNGGVTLDALAKRGVRIAICAMSTRRAATLIAQKTNGKVDEIFKELGDNLVPNGHLVPAGIVALSRAQERGYTVADVT